MLNLKYISKLFVEIIQKWAINDWNKIISQYFLFTPIVELLELWSYETHFYIVS